MKPAPFSYHVPETLDEALSVMNDHGYEAKILAGGQSLIPVMNFRLAQPAMLVDLNHLDDLNFIRATQAGGLRVGAMVRHREAEFNSICADLAPLMSEVMPYIAHPQIRNRGTIGGSLAHADPAAELPVVMTALEARFRLQRQGSERWVGARDFFQSLFNTALEAEEILTEVELPPILENTGYAFQELARRHGDYALAGIAAVITLNEDGTCRRARLVYLNVGDVPMVAEEAGQMMAGQRPTADLIEAAAAHAGQHEIEPMGDIHGSAAYKRHLAYVLGKRTIAEAVQRAQNIIG